VARFDRFIPPGGECKVILKVNTKGYEGNFSKAANVYTSDPRNRVVWIGLKAFIKFSISVSPGLIYFGGFASDAVKKVVTIRAQKSMPLSLKPISFSLSDKVEYRIETVEKGGRFRLVFKNISVEQGWYNGLLKIKTNYPDKPVITIRIIGKIRTRHRG
jgi:hypothetical protein